MMDIVPVLPPKVGLDACIQVLKAVLNATSASSKVSASPLGGRPT
jgi:hypothetical protein